MNITKRIIKEVQNCKTPKEYRALLCKYYLTSATIDDCALLFNCSNTIIIDTLVELFQDNDIV